MNYEYNKNILTPLLYHYPIKDFCNLENSENRVRRNKKETLHLFSKGNNIFIKYKDYTKFNMTDINSFTIKKGALYCALVDILNDKYLVSTEYKHNYSYIKIRTKGRYVTNDKLFIYDYLNLADGRNRLINMLSPHVGYMWREDKMLVTFLYELFSNIYKHNYLKDT